MQLTLPSTGIFMTKTMKMSLIFPMALVCYEIVNYLSNDMYLPALPQMMRELHLSETSAEFTLMWWFLGMTFSPIFMGLLADKYGRRPVLLWGGVIYTLSSLICTLSTSMTLFMIARFFQGAMVSAMFVAGYASIHESFEHKEAVKILALMASISILAPALGPLAGGYILYFAGWRAIFGIITVWAAINILVLYWVMPETRDPNEVVAQNFSKVWQQYKVLLTNKAGITLTFIMGFNMAAFLVWITASPLLVIKAFKLTPIFYGWCQMAVFVANIAGNMVTKQIADRASLDTLIHRGMQFCLVGVLLGLMTSFFESKSVILFVVSVMIFAFGSGISFAPLNRSIIESSTAPMGSRVAVFTIFLTLFCTFGSILSGVFYGASIFSVAGLMAICVIISYIILSLYRRGGAEAAIAQSNG